MVYLLLFAMIVCTVYNGRPKVVMYVVMYGNG